MSAGPCGAGPCSAAEVRLAELRRAGRPSIRLYALLDPLLEGSDQAAALLERGAGTIALFDDTEDAEIADHGPWLVDFAMAGAGVPRAAGGEGVDHAARAKCIPALCGLPVPGALAWPVS